MSLRQSIVSVLAGVALSFIPLGLSTLAGKRSGQPTMVVSRATFGVVGNVVPALLALVTRVFWGAVLLWLLASSVAVVLAGAQLDGGLGERLLLVLGLAAGLVIAMLVAVVGYHLIAQIQLVLSVVSGILIIGLIAMTAQYVDVPAALTTPDGPWLLTITGAVLVFSFVGLVWANSGADLARYQRPGSSGAASMLWSTIGATLPSFVLIGYGSLLAASDKGIASGFVQSPLDTLALMLPSWYPAPLIAATVLSLLSGIVITLYSGGFALQSVGVRVSRQWSVVIVGVLLAAIAVVLSFAVTGIMELFRDLATTLAVPTAAWAGIFAAEMMIRNRRFESESLLRRGGVYETVRWGNLIGFVVISAIGWGLTTATVTWLGWQGYLFGLLGVPLDTDLAGTDLGVLVALALGILLPIIIGFPAIRRQEEARP
jgi:purine-cytosine permease-like protein